MARILGEMKAVLGFVGTLWIAFLVSLVFPINNLGIVPRTTSGLIGIPLAVFLHLDLGHIIANSVALITFGILFALVSGRDTLQTIALISLGSGSITWLIARSANHIGASGLVFGLYGYLIAYGLNGRRIIPLLVAVFLLLSYGGLLFGILPIQRGVSWESHLSGLIFGWGLGRIRTSRARGELA